MKIFMTTFHHELLTELQDRVKHEISFLGHSEKAPEGICLRSLMIPKQTVTKATTTISPEGNFEAVKALKHVNTLCHTHPGMSSSFSGTDENTLAEMGKSSEWFLSVIRGNSSYSWKIWIRDWAECIEGKDVWLLDPPDFSLWYDQVKGQCQEPPVVPAKKDHYGPSVYVGKGSQYEQAFIDGYPVVGFIK